MSSAPTPTTLDLTPIRAGGLATDSPLYAAIERTNNNTTALVQALTAKDAEIAGLTDDLAVSYMEIDELVAATDGYNTALNTQLRGRRPSRWPFVLALVAVVSLCGFAGWMGFSNLEARGEIARLKTHIALTVPQQLEVAKRVAFDDGYAQAGLDTKAKERAAAEALADATYCFTDEAYPLLDMGDGMFAAYCGGDKGARIRFCTPPADAAEFNVRAEYCQNGNFSEIAGNCIDDNSPMSDDLGGGIFGLSCTDSGGDTHAMFCQPPADAAELDVKADYCIAAWTITTSK
jgi:hypothetical protein